MGQVGGQNFRDELEEVWVPKDVGELKGLLLTIQNEPGKKILKHKIQQLIKGKKRHNNWSDTDWDDWGMENGDWPDWYDSDDYIRHDWYDTDTDWDDWDMMIGDWPDWIDTDDRYIRYWDRDWEDEGWIDDDWDDDDY